MQIESIHHRDPELMMHLSKIRKISPESASILGKRIFTDTMVPHVGNKLAYEDFMSRPRKGVHVMIDGNDFGAINKKWGQSMGDNAIKQMFGAVSQSSRTMRGKLFRVGGDEGRLHFETPEQAYSFVRDVRKNLENLPPIKGIHGHSLSIGIAETPERAEQALINAKNEKKAMNYPVGQAHTHVHSLLPSAVPTINEA
jgi:GGDEF domain-containing protein